MEYVNCNLCGSGSAVNWGVKNSIVLVRCLKCGLVYCNPRPGNEVLKRFYGPGYFEEGNYEEDEKGMRCTG